MERGNNKAETQRVEESKKTVILKLYENTKDAVEVAKRNYLEFRIANGIQREMAEIQDKYGSLYHQSESQFSEVWTQFQNFSAEIAAAVKKLKGKSDDFVAVSSHGLPYRIEKMTLAEVEKIKLPDYAMFLFDSDSVSFGPISERWEKLKMNLESDFMSYLENVSQLTLFRTSGSLASNLDLYAYEGGDDEEMGSGEEYDDDENDNSVAVDGGNLAIDNCSARSPDDIIIIDKDKTRTASCSSSSSNKPEVAKRKKRMSKYKGGRVSIHQLLTSAAASAENKRSIRILHEKSFS